MSVNLSDTYAPAAATSQKAKSTAVIDRYRGSYWCSHVSLSVHPPSPNATAKTRKYFCNACGKRIAKSDPKLSVIRKVLAPRFPVEKALFYHLTDRCARDPVTMTMKYGQIFPVPDQVKGYNKVSSEHQQQLTQIITALSLGHQSDPVSQPPVMPTAPSLGDTSEDPPLKYQSVQENGNPKSSETLQPQTVEAKEPSVINSNNSNDKRNQSNYSGSAPPTRSACLRRRVPKSNADHDYEPNNTKANRSSDKQRFTAACRLAIAPQINAFRAANIDSLCSSSPSGTVQCEVSGEMICASSAQVDHAAPNTFQVIVERFLQKQSLQAKGSISQLLKRTAYVFGHFFDLRLRDEFAAFHQSLAHLRVVKSSLNQGVLKRKAITSTAPDAEEASV